jgi:hypothetical protein
MKVHRTLGAGFVEFVYRNALLHELKRAGLSVEIERPIKVRYEGILVGEFSVDLLIDGWLIVELTAARASQFWWQEPSVQTQVPTCQRRASAGSVGVSAINQDRITRLTGLRAAFATPWLQL